MNKPAKNTKRSIHITVASLFLGIVGITVFFSELPGWIFYLYAIVSLITFILYAIDKSAARRNAWRISEDKLHFFALAGGWPGALIAQQLLRHKTKKESFRSVFWVTVGVNVGLFVWLLTPNGIPLTKSLIEKLLNN